MDNWKAVLYLLASGQGLLLSFALIIKGLRSQRANLFLGLILYTISLELLNAWGMQVQYHRSPDVFPFWVFQSYLILPPAIWFFAHYSTVSDYTFRRRYIWAFAPALIDIFIQLSWTLSRRMTGHQLPPLLDNSIWFFCTEILPILGTAAAVGWFGHQLTKLFPIRSGRFLPLGEFVKRYSLFVFLAALTVLWAAGVLFKRPIFSEIELLLTLFLFVYAYLGYANSSYFDLRVAAKPKPVEKAAFPQFDDAKQWNRLETVFQQEALHTQSRLTLEDVAERLRLPARYVSYLINKQHGANFNQFVNTLRVEAVIRKLNDPAEQHKTLLALALEAGFNSKSTFNQVFRTHTGQSPSHYLTRVTRTTNPA
ncbi:helix-turn-helix domain-containing protein [Larkinella terrae]|uniref:Helix-turn-helix domain-containing protein n=1 Tax=Larkinella terrae TaxID=2025311 RepID=A0A7K0EQA1_9BACT|nr:helix-turn-helix domain-containing protein [Larkinella terrae]MRS63922.1 helix-turn-helix domain-containing protein [Larkinella terrae]